LTISREIKAKKEEIHLFSFKIIGDGLEAKIAGD